MRFRKWRYRSDQSVLNGKNLQLLTPDVDVTDIRENLKNMSHLINQSAAMIHDYCVLEDQRWQETLKNCSSNNTMVKALLENDQLRPWVRPYWARRKDWLKSPVPLCEQVPKTLTNFVAFCATEGTERGYMQTHNINSYSSFFSSLLKAVRMIPTEAAYCTNKTEVSSPFDVRLSQKIPQLIRAALVLQGRQFTTPDAAALAELFPYLECLEKLSVVNSRMPAAATRKIIDRLGELRRLKYLDLFGNAIDDEGVTKLTQTFIHLRSMKDLALEDNNITPAGVAIIARNIAKLQELERFIIGGLDEVAGSILAMTKAFLEMPKLRKAHLVYLRSPPTEIPDVEDQVREVVRLLKAKVYTARPWKKKLLYDATDLDSGRNASMASDWAAVISELWKDLGGRGVTVEASDRDLDIVLWVSCWCYERGFDRALRCCTRD
ncbi:hypothetical protein Bbelb_105800 [Branchiostoma belcheri]|nr:hypothetical protein Bbelb_105800 [Branchiostoma belcheri]